MHLTPRAAYGHVVLNVDRRLRGLLANEAGRTADAALASELVEIVARSLAEHQVPERVAAELDAEQLVTAALRNPAVRAAVAELIASEEVRRGIQQTAGGFGEELSVRLGLVLERSDDRLTRATTPSPYGGLIARAVAFVLDLTIVQAAVVIGAASLGLVLSLVGAGTSSVAAHTLGGIGWVMTVALYFAVFWSIAGQTPGMRVLGLRLARPDGSLPSFPRSLLRFAFLIVSIAIVFLGFVSMLFDKRRRGLHDVVAETVVLNQTPA
jgi:uncharacterized RDD family membrane protein YckC